MNKIYTGSRPKIIPAGTAARENEWKNEPDPRQQLQADDSRSSRSDSSSCLRLA